MIRSYLPLILAALLTFTGCSSNKKPQDDSNSRRLSMAEYRDKMKGGWVGQVAGVAWGAPTEFRWKQAIIPADKMPQWTPEMINNSFGQDDLYVEMTFLRTLETRGLDVPIRQAGIDWANSGYMLWHANMAGRTNLRNGIAPPDSGHPQFNKHADDIDYQIEADYSGLISPGLPNNVIQLGEKFGRLMNYGDGLYGGQFVGAMYAEAFFEKDPVKIVEAGLKAIPAQSQYAECIRDLLAWHKADPNNWEAAWQKIEEKYQKNPDYRKFSCDKGAFNIDAKINGAYIVMGLLFGKGDPDQTILIACRCGQDSDCNPSSAAGILFTTIGFQNLPAKFKDKLDETRKWSYTEYDFPSLIAACEKVARQAIPVGGGRIEKDSTGNEVIVLPGQAPQPSKLETCWTPGDIANSRFTPEEMAQIKPPAFNLKAAVDRFAPGWTASNCGVDMGPGIRNELGRQGVLVTHPLSDSIPCILSRTIEIPAGKKMVLRLSIGHHPQGDWVLVVKANGQELMSQIVGKGLSRDGWAEAALDLSEFAGQNVKIELLNKASGWSNEAGYWSRIAVVAE